MSSGPDGEFDPVAREEGYSGCDVLDTAGPEYSAGNDLRVCEYRSHGVEVWRAGRDMFDLGVFGCEFGEAVHTYLLIPAINIY